jgi:peroxiredoxin
MSLNRRQHVHLMSRITSMAIVLILAMVIPQDPAKSEAAQDRCEASAKNANLSFTLKDINGKNVALSAYKGQVILLDFWATWCPPCRKEIPGFIELYSTYKSRGLVVLGVSMDESVSDITPFVKQLTINYPILIGYERPDIEKAFGPIPLPTSFVIARDGRICGKHTGFVSKDQFEREIKALL